VKKVIIYTDGACSGNPGAGGWGAILKYGETEKEISGYEVETTNNRMELTAAIEALRCLKASCEVELYSDSAYLVNGFDKGWLEGWKANGWKNSSKDDVKNIDLWKELDGLNKIHHIQWIKVKGHSDNESNNRCDKLATGEIKKRVKAEKSKDLD
jgi:ribonuclease HI